MRRVKPSWVHLCNDNGIPSLSKSKFYEALLTDELRRKDHFSLSRNRLAKYTCISGDVIAQLRKVKGNPATKSNTSQADHTDLLYQPHHLLQALVAVRLKQARVQMQVQPQYYRPCLKLAFPPSLCPAQWQLRREDHLVIPYQSSWRRFRRRLYLGQWQGRFPFWLVDGIHHRPEKLNIRG